MSHIRCPTFKVDERDAEALGALPRTAVLVIGHDRDDVGIEVGTRCQIFKPRPAACGSARGENNQFRSAHTLLIPLPPPKRQVF